MKNKKFGVLDVIIILIIILFVVFVINYFGQSKSGVSTIREVSYTVELKSYPNEYKDVFKVGDQVNDSIKGGYMGEVIDVKIKPNAETREDTLNDQFVKTSFEDRFDAEITIKGTPTVSDQRDIKFATQNIKIGEFVHLKSKNYAVYGYITDINEIE